jgi:serine/threonine protein kinase
MGLSTYNPSNQVRQSFCGTVDYMSPEIASGKDYDHTVDLWSIGILAYELTTGDTPFYQQNKEDTMAKIVHGQLEFPGYLSEDLKIFVKAVVQKDPSKRLNIA